MREIIEAYRDLNEPRDVGLISLSHGLNEFYSMALPPILPLLIVDLDITYAQAGFLLTVFFIMYSIFQLPAGMLADRVGKKPTLVAGLLGMSIGLLFASTAADFETLLLAQIILGVTGSTYHPTGMAMISDVESFQTEGKAMGVFGLGGMLGVASGPLIIGGIAAFIDWRTALFVAAIAGFAVTLVFQVMYTSQGGKKPSDGHNPGTRTATSPCAQTDGTDIDGKTNTSNTPHENRGRGIGRVQQLFLKIFQFQLTTGIILITVVTMLVSLQTRSLQTFATGFMVDGVGQSPSLANAVFFLMLGASAVSAILFGNLADKFDRGKLGSVVALISAGLLFCTYILVVGQGRPPTWMLIGILVFIFTILGFVVYGCSPVKNALISEFSTTGSSGSIFGITMTASAAGSAIGPTLFGYFATVYGIGFAYGLIGIVSSIIAVGFFTLSREHKVS